jgi:cellulose synthase operon protein B
MEKMIFDGWFRILRGLTRGPTLLAASLLMLVTLTGLPTEAKSRKSANSGERVSLATDPVAVVDRTPTIASRQRVVSFTFKQLGALTPIRLRGVEGSQSLPFSIRSDEVVASAKLKFDYAYSPSLLPELSHLNVLLNGEVSAVLPLPRDKVLGNKREIDLDPRFFTDYNKLQFRLIGHYTYRCEDPLHSSLWLELSNLGRIELTLVPLALANDLKYLPAPFFERRDNAVLNLPFVFAAAPSFGTLKAAGLVASWFGSLASYRGARFPTFLNTLPEGNAVVFLQGNEKIGAVAGASSATVSIEPHPNNPAAKLLVVTGDNEEEMMRAARSIVLGYQALSGQRVAVTHDTEPPLRKPYDAPAWIASDRPVRFAELVTPEDLQVQGFYPDVIRVNFRVAPDLFTWRSQGVPIELKYRYTSLPLSTNSSLNVNVNGEFVRSLALDNPSKKVENRNSSRIPFFDKVPSYREDLVYMLPHQIDGRNQLQFHYYFDPVKEGECRDTLPDNLRGAIDPESTLDFSSFPRYSALPNLAFFSKIGFPFTRMADLSETAVVLPEPPNADEIATYLMLVGRMGEATAYPVLRLALVTASEVEKVAQRDLIVIGSAHDQTLMTKWADYLPLVLADGEHRLREPDIFRRAIYRWEQADLQATPRPDGTLKLKGSGNLTSLMAFESPLQSRRSVVLLHADKATDLLKIADVLLDPERNKNVQGDFVLVDEKGDSHAKIGETYYLGSLPLSIHLRWAFSNHPLLVSVLGILICILLAAIMYRALRQIAAKRMRRSPG